MASSCHLRTIEKLRSRDHDGYITSSSELNSQHILRFPVTDAIWAKLMDMPGESIKALLAEAARRNQKMYPKFLQNASYGRGGYWFDPGGGLVSMGIYWPKAAQNLEFESSLEMGRTLEELMNGFTRYDVMVQRLPIDDFDYRFEKETRLAELNTENLHRLSINVDLDRAVYDLISGRPSRYPISQKVMSPTIAFVSCVSANFVIKNGILWRGKLYTCRRRNLLKPEQCQRCWTWGHSAEACTYDHFVCCYCGVSPIELWHFSYRCQAKDIQKCVNCGAASGANHRDCPARLEEGKRIKALNELYHDEDHRLFEDPSQSVPVVPI